MSFLLGHHIIWANPGMLWLLLLLPLLVLYFYRKKRKRKVHLHISALRTNSPIPSSWRIKLRGLVPILEAISFVCIVIALARPQKTDTNQTVNSEGINIMLSLDISGSMLSEDFKPNRIDAAKKIAVEFVQDRPNDRIGLVIFAAESFTQCPLTIDHNVLINQIEQVKSGMLVDGTALGMGLGTAVDRLRNAKGKSKVIILMTDGVNNTGKIDPQTAMELAKAFNIKVYTIGIGTRGEALYPVQTPMGIQKVKMPVEIDEPLLKKIAAETGGEYFRATDNKSLKEIYHHIDQLEKTKIEVNSFTQYQELFFPFVLVALAALFLAFLLQLTLFRSVTS